MSEANAETRKGTRGRVRWIGMPELRARYGDVSPDTIKRWIALGVLPAPVPMGTILLWSEADLDEADERSRAKAQAALEARTKRRLELAEHGRQVQKGNREKEEQARAAAHEAVHAAQDQVPAPSSSPARKRRKSSMMS